MIKSCILGSFLAFGLTANAAVTVHINSGNPAYPFPQFLEYACGGNLGTANPEGLVHAEMEKLIRTAYQQHANEFDYTGDEYNGIKYIETPYKAAYDCSEGDGYALLAAAYMADKVTFDGYWMCTHDKRRVKTKKYMDCTDNAMDYQYGDFALSDGATAGGNTAADGDVDVALALYVAYKQWGEFMLDSDGNVVNDACGNPISYKQEMINVIRGLVAMSSTHMTDNPRPVNTGIIGLDGYNRGGDTWREVTSWASQEENFITASDGVKVYPLFEGAGMHHIDYNAPSYFREFHDLLISLADELGATNDWEAEQFRRAEASSDWLIGDLIGKNQYSLPTAGWCNVSDDGSSTEYSNFNEGEDYRCPWRTISNYVWHGNPSYSWNPSTHQVVSGGNTYEYDAAIKMTNYMLDPANWNTAGGTECYTKGDKVIPYTGPRMMGWMIDPMTGVPTDTKNSSALGMQKGAAAFAAIGSQNYQLMGDLFREVYEDWDVKGTTDDGQWISNYMSGWFRQTGLLALSGNYPAPSAMNPKPNVKVYRAAVDSVSVCHVGDVVGYIVSYRNYGAADASDVVIVETLPADFEFVDAANGGVYSSQSNTVTWNIGTIPGFKSDNIEGADIDFSAPNLAKTIGSVSYRCKPKAGANGRYQGYATITYNGGEQNVSNEYPNYVTATMQRNCIDVVAKALNVSKSSDVTSAILGDVVSFEVSFANDSLPWLTGGRRDVNVAVADANKGTQYNVMAKIYNDAAEPYIDNGNYRITLFKDATGANLQCSFDLLEGTQNGATMGSNASSFVFVDNVLADNTHKFSIQFPHALATSTLYLNEMAGASGFNCEGAKYPLRVVMRFNDSGWKNIDWTSGWSKLTEDSDEGFYYPVTPSYQDFEIVEPVTKLLKSACDDVEKTTTSVLVEEFDGYVWRKILGNSPEVNGSVAANVVITDTVPAGLEFVEFTSNLIGAVYTPSSSASYSGLISYSASSLEVGAKGTFSYTCRVSSSDKIQASSSCSIKSDDDNSVSDVVTVNLNGVNTGVERIDSESNSCPVDVYSSTGVLVKKNVNSSNALDGLETGVYVVGNKKALKVKK